MRQTRNMRKALGVALVALVVAVLPGDRAQALGGSDRLDIFNVTPSAGADSLSAGCSPEAACTHLNAPAQYRLATTGTGLTISGSVLGGTSPSNLQAGCYNVDPSPCLVVEAVAGDGGFVAGPGTTTVSLISSLGGTGAHTFQVEYSFATVVSTTSNFYVRVQIYQDTAKTTPLTEEFFVVEYEDPAAAIPFACITNIPPVNELGRRTTRTGSFAATGRVEPRQAGTAVPNPIASSWAGTCGGSATGADDKVQQLTIDANGSVVSSSAAVLGSAAGCDEPMPATSVTTPCDNQGGAYYPYGTFTMGAVSLSTSQVTTIALQALNDAGNQSVGGERYAGGLRDEFDLYLDNSAPTLGAGNLTLLEPDLNTRQSFNATAPVTVQSDSTSVNLFGTMSDAQPGQIAYVSFDYSNNVVATNVNSRTGEMLLSVTDYKGQTDNGRIRMKSGDFVRFDSASTNPNKGLSFRIHTITEQTRPVTAENSLTHSGAASVGPFAGALAYDMIAQDGAFSIQNQTTSEICSDGDFDGVLTCGSGGSGTIDYRTGQFSVTWNGALANGANIVSNYSRIYAFSLDLAGDSFPGSPSIPGEQVNELRVIQVLNNTAYNVAVNGQTYGILSDGSATAEEIATDLAACLSTPASCDTVPGVNQMVLGFPVKDSGGNVSVVRVEAANIGLGFNLAVVPASASRIQFRARSIDGVALVDAEQTVDVAIGGITANATYTVTLNGNNYSINAGATPTGTTILQALSDCVTAPSMVNCSNATVPPAPTGISVSGPTGGKLTIADSTPGAAPATGFTVSASANLAVAPRGAMYRIQRSAYAAMRANGISGGGVLDFNDAPAIAARAFDRVIGRGALATGAGAGDWVLFASNDTALSNRNQRFRILAVNTGARTVTISTTSATGQTLVTNYSASTPRVYFIRTATGRLDGDDAELGYGCGRCAGETWGVDLELKQGSKLFELSVYDDAGNRQSTPWTADISFNPIIITADPPRLTVDRVWLYPDLSAAQGDTNANLSSATACDPDGAGAGTYNGNFCDAAASPGCHEMSLNPVPIYTAAATGNGPVSWTQVTIVGGGDLVSMLALNNGKSLLSDVFTSQVPVPIHDAVYSGGNTIITIPLTSTSAMGGNIEILGRTAIQNRIVGQCTGVKVVGRIVLDSDPTVPAYSPGSVPEFTFGEVDFSANVLHDPSNPDGKHFVWFANVDVPLEIRVPNPAIIARANPVPAVPTVFTYVSGASMVPTGCPALPGGTITSRVTALGQDLASSIGLNANDKVTVQTTDATYGPVPVACVYFAGGNTVIEFLPTTMTGDPVEYWIPRRASDSLKSYNITIRQDNVANTPSAATTTGFNLDRTPPTLGVAGFIEGQRNINFSPSISLTDAHLNMTPPVVSAGGVDLDLTNPGAWSLLSGTGNTDCASNTSATQVTLLGRTVAASLDPVTDMVIFETNGGSYGPVAVLAAQNSAGNTLLTISETCVNATPNVTGRPVRVIRPTTRLRLFRATDIESNVVRLEVDVDALTSDPTMGDAFGVPLVTTAADPTCSQVGPIPSPQCDGVPVSPIPACRSSFYSLPNAYNPPRTCDNPPTCNLGGQYPYRVACEIPLTNLSSFNNVIIGNEENERGSYRFEIYAADTATPPNVLAAPSTAGDTGPVDLHFSAVITDSQLFLNDFFLIFLNQGGSELNPLDLCPPDINGDPQSLFECMMDPVFTVLADNPTDVRNGGSTLMFFFDGLSFVIGQPGSIIGSASDDAAFNSMALNALSAIQEIFPSMFNSGAVDSDIATLLNLLKNSIDRHMLDELSAITFPEIIDPDNDALTPDGIESLEPLLESIKHNDGKAYRVALMTDTGSQLGVQEKSSSPFVRMLPALLDLISYEDFRGMVDVFNKKRIIGVPQINDLGTITLEQRPIMPLLYESLESLFDGFDPLLLVDTVNGTSAVVWDFAGDGQQNPRFETRCYEAYDDNATAPVSNYVPAGANPRPQAPTDCYCVSDGGVIPDGPDCARYGLDPDFTETDPGANSRHFARMMQLLSEDECASVDNAHDMTECRNWVENRVAPDYDNPRSELYEGNSLDNLLYFLHQLLDFDNPPGGNGVSQLAAMHDVLLCLFEPVRGGQIQRSSPVDRIFPILSAFINQTGARDIAECSGGGQFRGARLSDVQCRGDGWALPDGDNFGPVRILQGARGIECPEGEDIVLDINSEGLAPGEYCTAGELIFPEEGVLSLIKPKLEVLKDPLVLNQLTQLATEFPDLDVLLESYVAASDQGLLKRKMIAIGYLFDFYDNGLRSGIPECGTPGASVGGCRTPGLSMTDVLLDIIDGKLFSPRAPRVVCSVAAVTTCRDKPAPGTLINLASHPGCNSEGQTVFCDAENLPISVLLQIFDELFVPNPPSGCEFFASGVGVPGAQQATDVSECNGLRTLDFDISESIFNFLDDYLNETLDQSGRDSFVEMVPTLMSAHQRGSTAVASPASFQRIIPGPRPLITDISPFIGNPDSNPSEPGIYADAQIWPPDRAFPSPILQCSSLTSEPFEEAPDLIPTGDARTCWTPDTIFIASTIPGRIHGRNPYDEYLCDDFNCYASHADNEDATDGVGVYGASLCGGADGPVGPSTLAGSAAANNAAGVNGCLTKGKFTQKLKNPYFGCYKSAASRLYAWNTDLLFSQTEGLPETPADCADSSDLVRALDEAFRADVGIDLFVDLLGLGLITLDGNSLLSSIAGFVDPSYMPSVNLTYKTFGVAADVPSTELLTLFAALRAARGLLANALLGGSIVFRQTCTGFVATETGSIKASAATHRGLAGIIDRTAALEPLARHPAFAVLQGLLGAMAAFPNIPTVDPAVGLYQTNMSSAAVGKVCGYANFNGTVDGTAPGAGGAAFDAYPRGHSGNPNPSDQMTWGQGPVLLNLLTRIESTGYAQSELFRLLVGLEEGPSRETLDTVMELLGDMREVTSDLDPRIPPGKNMMELLLDAGDLYVSPRDGTTVPCGNDGDPCQLGTQSIGFSGAFDSGFGRDKKNYYKDGGAGDLDGINGKGPTDAEPLLYTLLPVLLQISGVKDTANNAIIRRCVPADWSFVEGAQTKGCTSENAYGYLIPQTKDDFSEVCGDDGVCDCGAAANGGVCPEGARADYVYIHCQGGAAANCDRNNPGGALLPGVGGPSSQYSYLSHKFQIVHRKTCTAQDGLSGTCLVLAHKAFDNPVITIDQSAGLQRKADIKIQNFVRASVTKGLRSIGKVIVDDYNQDPDVPGFDVLETDEVFADVFRCDSDGYLVDTALAMIDDKTPVDAESPNADLRSLRNVLVTMNSNIPTRDAKLKVIGSTLGATGGAEIIYSNVNNHPDPLSCEIISGNRGYCRGDAPLTQLLPILRENAEVEPLEQYALQRSLGRTIDPFNQAANKRLSPIPGNCTGPGSTNAYGIPHPDCRSFVDPIVDLILDGSAEDTTDRGTGNDAKIAEVRANGWTVPNPNEPLSSPAYSDNLSGFRGQLIQVNNGAGVSGLDSWTSMDGTTGDCDFGPNKPDGILDDCNGNNVPDFLARIDSGNPDGFFNGGGNADFMVGHWYRNDTTEPIQIVSVSFYHDGVAGKTAVTNDPARVGRMRVLGSNASFGSATLYTPEWNTGTGGLAACMFATTSQASCMGGALRVYDFYFRDRAGIQTVPIYPPITVQPGHFAVVTVQQPTPGANPFGIGVDTRGYDTWAEVNANALSPTSGPPDFYSDTPNKLKRLSALTGMNAVPIMRVGYTHPISLANADPRFESALALLRRKFEKPSLFAPAPKNNPNRVRPIEPLLDMALAMMLPMDVSPKNMMNPAEAIPATCERVQGASGTSDFFVFLPHLTEPDGTVRRQKCDYPGGAETDVEKEMEVGLGCADPDGFMPNGVPCWATPRGIVPADLDDSKDFVTPLELYNPLLKRILTATYPDPIPNDPMCPAEAVPGPSDGLDCIDPGMTVVDKLALFELLFSPLPPLSCPEVNALGGECDEATGVITRQGAMTTKFDRLMILPKVLAEVSNDPAQWRYRFFASAADATCGTMAVDPTAKCDATSANLLNIMSGLMTPVTLYDRVTGVTDPEPRPLMIRLLDRYATAFFPQIEVPPSLPPQALAPRISLNPIDTEVFVREGYGAGGPGDCVGTDPAGGNIALPECKYFLDVTVNHGQIAGVEQTINERQRLDFSLVPDSGTWRLTYNDGGPTYETVSLPFNANPQAVANALNALTPLSQVDVTGDYATGFLVAFNGLDGGRDHLPLTVTSNSLFSGATPVVVTPSTQCDYDEPCVLGGSQPLAGAVVSVGVPDDLKAGQTNALHVAAYHGNGEIGDSLLMLKIADSDQMGGTYTVQAGDYLEYGMLVPSISHVKSVGVNLVFNTATSGACTANGNAVTNPETIRLFDTLPLAQRQCLQQGTLRFGTTKDQQSRTVDTALEITTVNEYIHRKIPLSDEGPIKVAYTGEQIGNASVPGVYIEFNTVEGGPAGRAEAYFSFIKITRSVGPDIVIYDGGAAAPVLDVQQSRGYSPIDETTTVAAGGMITLDTRQNSIVCPTTGADNTCPDTTVAAACMGAPTLPAYSNYFAAMTGTGVIGDRGCDSPVDGAIRVRTNGQGRARIPIKASEFPFRDRIEIQVRCGDVVGGVCTDQELTSVAEVQVRKGGSSSPSEFTGVTRYPPRPMAMEFESRHEGTRPVFQTTAIDDPKITNIKTGEGPEDDSFFLDTRILDQRGDPFTGFVRTDLAFDDEPIKLDYAVIARPALHLDVAGATSTTSLTVIGTGAERSTGPYIQGNGDYLEYEVYFQPEDANENVGIDIQSAVRNGDGRDLRTAAIPGMPFPAAADQTVLASGSLVGGSLGGVTAATEGRVVDQNLRAAHPAIDLRTAGAPAANSNFYYRRMPIPDGFTIAKLDSAASASNSSRVFAALWNSSGTGNVDMWFRNIRIGNNGRAKYTVYDEDTGLRPLRLSGSPCNNRSGGAPVNCPASITALTCPGGGTDYHFVFDSFTGLDVESTSAGDLVMLLSGSAATALTNPSANSFTGENAAYTPAAPDIRIRACNVTRDPVVVFEVSAGTLSNADYRDGLAIRVANQGGTFGNESNLIVNTGTQGAGTAGLCADTRFGNNCTNGAQLPVAAVGDGRFCTGTSGVDYYGKRCTAAQMRALSTADSADTYSTDRVHLLQRARRVVGDESLYRYNYTMGVSSGRQSVEVRTVKPATVADYNVETVPYVNLLRTQTFVQYGNPPPVPSKIIFDTDYDEDTFNNTVGAPGSFADMHVQLLDQYGTPWQGPWPIKWDVTAPRNAIRMRGTANSAQSAFLGLKLNTGMTARPRWFYPLTNGAIPHSNDVDVHTGAGQVGLGRLTLAANAENSDGDSLIQFTTTTTGLIPGDTIRIGTTGAHTVTAVVSNVYGQYVELSSIVYLGGECDFTGTNPAWGYNSTTGANANELPSMAIPTDRVAASNAWTGIPEACTGGTTLNVQGYTVYVTNPTTAGDDMPCHEVSGPLPAVPYSGSPSRCERPGDVTEKEPTDRWSSKFGSCAGGNFNRGADGAWRDVGLYNTDDNQDDNTGSHVNNEKTEAERHCFETNFTPGNGLVPNGGTALALAAESSPQLTRDTAIGSTRFNYAAFNLGVLPDGGCGFNNDYELFGINTTIGAMAWNCIPGSMRFDMLVPAIVDNDPLKNDPAGHVGIEFAGLVERGEIKDVDFDLAISLAGIPITLRGTLSQPYRSRIRNMGTDYTTSSLIPPHTSKILIGVSDPGPRLPSDGITVWGEEAPGATNNEYRSAGSWDRGALPKFDAYASNAEGAGFSGVDSFSSRVISMPRIGMYFANTSDGGTVNQLVCRGSTQDSTCTSGDPDTRAVYDSRVPGPFYARQGLWMAMVQSTTDGGSSNGRDSEFYLRRAQMASSLDIATLISAKIDTGLFGIPVSLVLPQFAILPAFVTHTYYDGDDLLPSTSVSNYARASSSQPTVDGDNDNTTAFTNPDIRIAGGQVKICDTNDVAVVLPVPLPDEPTLDVEFAMAGCPYTTSGQSRPGSFAIARVNDPMPGDGKMYGRLYFPPWPNETVEFTVGAPGVPPLIYQRNIVRGAVEGTGAEVNLRPVALDPPEAIGVPPTIFVPQAGLTPLTLTGTDDGPVSQLLVNVDNTGLSGTLSLLTGQAPLAVQYNPLGFTGSTSFTFTVTDKNGTGAISFPETVDIFVIDPLKRPIATPVGPINGTEDVNTAAFALNGGCGPDGTGPIWVEVTSPPANGTVYSGGTPMVPGTQLLAHSGCTGAGLSVFYDNDPNFCGTDTFQFVALDVGVAAPINVPSDPVEVTVILSCVNDAPTWIGNSTPSVFEDTPFTLGIVVEEVDDAAAASCTPGPSGDCFEVALTATNGIVTMQNLSGITISSGSNGSAAFTIEGTLGNINAAIATAQYLNTPVHYNSASSVTRVSATVNDRGNTGSGSAQMATKDLTFAVQATNDAPVVTGGPASIVLDEDTEQCITPAFSINDTIDAHNNPMRLTLAVAEGTVRLNTVPGGLTFTEGDGSASTVMTFQGLAADLNAAIASGNICYRGDLNYFGTDTFQLTVNDLGNIDWASSALGTTASVPITVNPIDDDPQAVIVEPTAGALNVSSVGADYSSVPGGGLDIPAFPNFLNADTSTVIVDSPILDVTVALQVASGCDGGQWAQDFIASLVHPLGDEILLVFQRGGDNTAGMQPTIFDDAAATAISAVPPGDTITGTFRPEIPLSTLVGLPSAGVWTVRITDASGVCFSQGKAGKLQGIQVDVTTRPDDIVLAPGDDIDVRGLCLDVDGDAPTFHSWNGRGATIPFGGTAVNPGMFTGIGCRSTLGGSDGAGCPDWSIESPSDGSPAGPFTPDASGSQVTYPLTYECDAGGAPSNVATKNITIANTPPSVLIITPNPNSPIDSGWLNQTTPGNWNVPDNNTFVYFASNSINFPGSPVINAAGLQVEICLAGNSATFFADTEVYLVSPAQWAAQPGSAPGTLMWAQGAHTGGCLAAPVGGTYNGQNPNGVWRVRARDTNCHTSGTNGCQSGDEGSVGMNPKGTYDWRIRISYSDSSGVVGVTAGTAVNFTAICSDPDGHVPLSYSWNLDDAGFNPPVCAPGVGACATLSPGNLTLANAGLHNVVLTCYDAFGLGSNSTVNVNVTDGAPVATITGGPTSLAIGVPSGAFTGTCVDPDVGHSTTRLWDFGPGATPPTSTATSPTGIVWTTGGAKTVTLTCIDQYGAMSSPPGTRAVTIVNNAPVATISAPTDQSFSFQNPTDTGNMPEGDACNYVTSPITVSNIGSIEDIDAQVSLKNSRDSNVEIILDGPDGTTLVLSNGNGGSGDDYTNTRFDDEAGTAITAGGAPFTGSYRPEGGSSTCGTTTVETDTLSGYDGKSMTGTWSMRASDNDNESFGTPGPITDFQLFITAPFSVPAGSTANFSGSCFDADGHSTTLLWNFGAGAIPQTSTIANPTGVTWTTSGRKSVTLTCTDQWGLAGSPALRHVDFLNNAPVATISAPAAPPTIPVGVATVNFAGSCFDADGHSTTFLWNFGAGATPPTSTVSPQNGVSWSTTGVKTVTLTCTDQWGLAGDPATINVTVNNQAPNGTITAPTTSSQGFVGTGFPVNDDNSDGTYQSGSQNVGMGATYIESFLLEVCMTNDPEFESDTDIQLASPAVGYTQMWNQGAHAGSCQTNHINGTAYNGTNPNGSWTLRADDSNCHTSGTNGCQSGDEGSINSWTLNITFGPTITAGNPMNFQGSCSDPDGHVTTPTWTFQKISGPGATPGSVDGTNVNVVFPGAGVFRGTLTCTDAFGLADPSPAVSTTFTVQ